MLRNMTVRQAAVWGPAVLAGGLALGAVAAHLAARDGGLVVVRSLDRPFLAFVLVAALTVAALLTGVRSLRGRIIVGLGTFVVALLCVPVAMIGIMDGGRTESLRRAAPGQGDRTLVVETGHAMIDPLWWVSVEQGSGLTARRWHVGYFNGDAVGNEMVEAAWDGPGRIRLTTGDGAVHLVELATNGRPRTTVSRGY
ncbi:hypothetical protein ACIA8O_36610 [Kitasatospora sp. NPDC051853]|uniref:hypothetical protein n=1 Tax=Kitasatospora sp. NPDC051853 TaxID=3364058 RepID=UPI003794463C